jgi:hypothetical protein
MITEKELGAILKLVKEYVEPAFAAQSDNIQEVVDGMRAEFNAKFKAIEDREAAELKSLETLFHVRDK